MHNNIIKSDGLLNLRLKLCGFWDIYRITVDLLYTRKAEEESLAVSKGIVNFLSSKNEC